MTDIATRVWNHKWKIDPIVRSLIDTDFYKLLMCQSVFRNKPDTQVTFSLINRVQTHPAGRSGRRGRAARTTRPHPLPVPITRRKHMDARQHLLRQTPNVHARIHGLVRKTTPATLPPRKSGRTIRTHLRRAWPEVMLWEIPALAVLMELRGRAVLGTMGRFELEVLYARAKTRVWEKSRGPARGPRPQTRRLRHTAQALLPLARLVRAGHAPKGSGDNFIGTSNCLIAKHRDLAAIGTNAHELPMVYAALAPDDAALRQAPYDVLADWQAEHDGNLRIILPDTYGTAGFLEGAPDWLAGWTGIRSRQRRPRNRGRNGHQLVEIPRRRPHEKTGHLLGRAGRRQNPRTANPIRRTRAACPSAGAPC